MKWLLWFLPLWIHIAQAQTPGKSPNIDSVEQRSVPVKNSALAILDVWTLHPDMWTELPTSAIHPTVDSLLTPTQNNIHSTYKAFVDM